MDIFVTGVGIISAIGNNAAENYQSLIDSKSGIQKAKYLITDQDQLAGEVKLSNEELISRYNVNHLPVSRTSLLGIAAATEAWGNNVVSDNIRTGLISSTSVGGMDRSEKYYRQLLQEEEQDISLILTHDSGSTSEKIADYLGIEGYVNTLSTACSSGVNAIMLGARLIRQNKLDRVIVGGTDALTEFTINGFKSLMIYSDEWCKPFDENREGLNLGEGAAYLVLESAASIQKSNNKPLCKLTGWCNAADAYHQTASSPDGKGATLAIQGALKEAGISPEKISYINAHGTGTKNNDLSESTALLNIFGKDVPPFSSTKAYTGHTLAAAGAIEAVFSVFAIQNSVLFPNLNYKEAIADTQLVPVTELTTGTSVEAVLSNSFGFGGNNSTFILEKL